VRDFISVWTFDFSRFQSVFCRIGKKIYWHDIFKFDNQPDPTKWGFCVLCRFMLPLSEPKLWRRYPSSWLHLKTSADIWLLLWPSNDLKDDSVKLSFVGFSGELCQNYWALWVGLWNAGRPQLHMWSVSRKYGYFPCKLKTEDVTI